MGKNIGKSVKTHVMNEPAGSCEAVLALLSVCSISRQEFGNSLIPETVKAGRQTEEMMDAAGRWNDAGRVGVL